ncbi:MAG: phosphatase PAP2 family protein [Eubacterium sp.]|nr:phosphatase PAP2 family protein [Eubacterium sp.]
MEKNMSKIIKKDSIIPLIFAVSFNMAVYFGSRIIAGNWHHYNIESSLDRLIPIWAPSVIIYLGCYLFWAANYIIIAQQEKDIVCQFFSADFLSRIVCLIFYLVVPTTNVRPNVDPSGFWNQLLLYLYSIDAADNLFPSIHCLVSWFCYIGIRGNEKIPKWYRGLSCIMALLVCASTLLTKQHVIIDVIGGILLAEFCIWFSKKTSIWKVYQNILNYLNKKIFSIEGE